MNKERRTTKMMRTKHTAYATIVDGSVKSEIDKRYGLNVTNLLVFNGDGSRFNGIVPLYSIASGTHTANGGIIDAFPHAPPYGDVAAFMIAVIGYDANPQALHAKHAISAVKVGDTLYAFNAWGGIHLPVDNVIFNDIASMAGCSKGMQYTGDNLQSCNRLGACAGYASNFVTEILDYVLLKGNNPPISSWSQEQYNWAIETALKSRSALIKSYGGSAHPHNIFAGLNPGFGHNSKGVGNIIENDDEGRYRKVPEGTQMYANQYSIEDNNILKWHNRYLNNHGMRRHSRIHLVNESYGTLNKSAVKQLFNEYKRDNPNSRVNLRRFTETMQAYIE